MQSRLCNHVLLSLLHESQLCWRTLPPGFMPMTAVDSAGGGLGPDPPANSPPAVSPAIFVVTFMDSPTVNSNGCNGSRGSSSSGNQGPAGTEPVTRAKATGVYGAMDLGGA
eukprot:GHRQ01028950.1.p3 GENE.GHRQ01028950.1~~GHRQ01028950.1.p3  ORF type:complete len:111 (+),score=31.16 GHRQ01028950.1:245-577(+)